MIVNSAKPLKLKTKADVHYVNATEIALTEIGAPIYNTTMLGPFVKLTKIVKLKTMEAAIQEVLAKLPHAIEEKNINAMKAAYNAVKV